jgi:PAS domain S-box-containing protein
MGADNRFPTVFAPRLPAAAPGEGREGKSDAGGWPIKPYAAAIALAAAAAALRVWPLQALGGRLAWLTFYPAVMVAALYGGLWAGLLGTIFSCLAVLFLLPVFIHQPFLRDSVDWLGLAVFFATCAMFSSIAEASRRARARERQTEAELDRFFTLSVDMLCIANADGYFKRVSAAFPRTLGWSVEEMRARPFLDFVHPDDHAATLREVEKQVMAGEKVLQFENRYRHKDGSWRVLSWKSVPGAGGFMYATAHDVTEFKRTAEATAALLKELTDVKAALDAHSLVAITDAQGRTTFVNDKYCATSQYSREELIGHEHRITNSGHHPKEFMRDLWTTITQGRVWKGEIKNRAKDGSFYWVDTTIVPFVNPDGQPFQYVAIQTDITERKTAAEEISRLNADLRDQNERLEAVNQELGAFSYSISHDLRAPLRHINGFAGLLAKHADAALDETGRRYIATISGAAKQMGRLIDDLLAFSRMGRAPLNLTNVDQDALVAAVIHDGRYEQNGSAIAWGIAPLATVRADAAMLRQVWVNLIDNAVKYSGKAAQPRIIIASRTDLAAGEHVFSVCDQGAGFDMAYVDKLFGVFQRLHDATEFEGTGIGLANVRRIVTRHGGRTWAEGKVGEGAAFYFSLPVTPPTSTAST